MEPMIKEAVEHEQIFMHNPILRREYEAREKATRDEKSRMKTARDEGLEKGLEKGAAKERIKVKEEIILNGLNNKTIAQLASVPPATVEEIAKKNPK